MGERAVGVLAPAQHELGADGHLVPVVHEGARGTLAVALACGKRAIRSRSMEQNGWYTNRDLILNSADQWVEWLRKRASLDEKAGAGIPPQQHVFSQRSLPGTLLVQVLQPTTMSATRK